MEELTKQQIVLVTLLISFVTSIATGIVTVALMDQAPPGVSQTINRVVERTIEKVVQSPTQQAASVVTKETIVVKEDDLVVAAVEKNTKSLVSVFAVLGGGDGVREVFLGNGLVISKDGLIAVDASMTAPILDDNQNLLPETFKAVLADGAILPIVAAPQGGAATLLFFKPTLDDKTKNTVFIPATIASAEALKLGQTIIALGGEHVSVATGIVSNLSANAIATTTPSGAKPQTITTDIHTVSKTPGAILLNLSGDVVGLRAAAAGGADNVFLSAGIISGLVPKTTPVPSH